MFGVLVEMCLDNAKRSNLELELLDTAVVLTHRAVQKGGVSGRRNSIESDRSTYTCFTTSLQWIVSGFYVITFCSGLSSEIMKGGLLSSPEVTVKKYFGAIGISSFRMFWLIFLFVIFRA